MNGEKEVGSAARWRRWGNFEWEAMRAWRWGRVWGKRCPMVVVEGRKTKIKKDHEPGRLQVILCAAEMNLPAIRTDIIARKDVDSRWTSGEELRTKFIFCTLLYTVSLSSFKKWNLAIAVCNLPFIRQHLTNLNKELILRMIQIIPLWIFVGGLDSSVTDDLLRQVFSPYGELVHVKIPVGKRCGFVQFSNRFALQMLNGTPLGGQNIRLSWGRTPANKQSQQEQNQWNGNYYGYSQGYNAYGYAPPQQDPNMYAYASYQGYGNYQQQSNQPQQ
ncbi:hypothetical protein KFK09_015962 [Dendrobium nobile]|uniref:RRM domain-containing protein n=1 Tax=Dendrobium nobile TaxID=94219 RepID=A0A8T3B7S1_DENNO|nr:hypothetical protein KFK09_015962 [Dendrobium nobile]